jgi:hypothetical protein
VVRADGSRRERGGGLTRDGFVRADMTPGADQRVSTPLWWDREIFLSDEDGDKRCPAVIDVTGRARYLFFGPFLPLTRGAWRATVHLQLCRDAALRSLALQFGVEPDYTTLELERGVSGSQAPQLDFTCETPGMAQIRLWLRKAAFHGEVRFAGVSVEKIDHIE